MDDAAAVSSVQRPGNLSADCERLIQRERSAGETIGKRLTLDVFHDQVIDAAVAADVVDSAGVRMRQRRGCARFPLEPFDQFWIVGGSVTDDLDGDHPIQPTVTGAVHFAHSADTKGRQDFVGTKTSADVQHDAPIIRGVEAEAGWLGERDYRSLSRIRIWCWS